MLSSVNFMLEMTRTMLGCEEVSVSHKAHTSKILIIELGLFDVFFEEGQGSVHDA